MSDISVWTIDRTLSAATNPNQSDRRNNGNEWVLRIPQASVLLESHYQIV